MIKWMNYTGELCLYEHLFTFQLTKLYKYLSHRTHQREFIETIMKLKFEGQYRGL